MPDKNQVRLGMENLTNLHLITERASTRNSSRPGETYRSQTKNKNPGRPDGPSKSTKRHRLASSACKQPRTRPSFLNSCLKFRTSKFSGASWEHILGGDWKWKWRSALPSVRLAGEFGNTWDETSVKRRSDLTKNLGWQLSVVEVSEIGN